MSALIELEVSDIIIWQLLSGLGAARLVSPWPPVDDRAKPFGDLEVKFEATVRLSSKNSTLALTSINSEIRAELPNEANPGDVVLKPAHLGV